GNWSMDQVVPAQEILDAIDAVFPLERDAVPTLDPAPAERYRYADGVGDLGVIASVTQPFCGSCDRVRITAEGKFRTCLFALDEFDLRAILRGGGNDDDLAAKEPTHRRAVARCRVYMESDTAAKIAQGAISKGDVLAVARVAGIQAAKQTSNLLPLCHPLLIGSIYVNFRIEESHVEVEA